MIEFKVKPFLDAQDLLVQWSILLHNERDRFPDGVSEKLRRQIADQLSPLSDQLERHEFDMCRLGVERFMATLERTNRPPEIVSEVDDLRRRLIDQGRSIYCLSLSKRERDLYEPKGPLFGAEVEAKFPNMSEDVAEAAKCLALERSTAAVFHLYAVKLAWRNEVMHPKQTYTTEEAEEIYRNVRTFIRDLAGLV